MWAVQSHKTSRVRSLWPFTWCTWNVRPLQEHMLDTFYTMGDRKGIQPVKNCWWWHFDWSFARLTAPVVTTFTIILSCNKIQNGDILAPANPGPPGKWPLKRRESVVILISATIFWDTFTKMVERIDYDCCVSICIYCNVRQLIQLIVDVRTCERRCRTLADVGNKISECGAEMLLLAVREQQTHCHSTAVTKLTGVGLMRLCIQVCRSACFFSVNSSLLMYFNFYLPVADLSYFLCLAPNSLGH